MTTQERDTYYAVAVRRIDANETLNDYRDALLYDWQDDGSHIKWVATAPTYDLISWAETVTIDEVGDAHYADEYGDN